MATGGEIIPRLYTRAGDHGTTGLAGGARVAKTSARIRTYGAYDELGAHLGVAYAALPERLTDLRAIVRRLQQELFVAQSELAQAPDKGPARHVIEARHVQRLERDLDRFEEALPPLRSFVVNAGTPAATELHVCRTVARRAERELLTLHETEPQRAEHLQWVNRLSDLLFALALATNHASGVAEIPPDYDA